MAVARMAPEFQDHHQKVRKLVQALMLHNFLIRSLLSITSLYYCVYVQDAHEFLTTVLDQIRSLSPDLQMIAACKNNVYSCPVETYMEFRIQNTRTCKRYSYTVTLVTYHT